MLLVLTAAQPPEPFSNAAIHHSRYLDNDFPPTANQFAILLNTSKSIDHLHQIHASLIRHGLHYNPILNFKLHRSYSSLGRLDHSFAIFAALPTPNIFSWTSIIHAHAIRGLHSRAFSLYSEMLTHGVQPNPFTFSSLLKFCPLSSARYLHSQSIKFGFDCDPYVRTSLLDVYAKGGRLICARKLFDTMLEKNAVSFTAMIVGYAKIGDMGSAREVFDGMSERDVVCWNAMIDGYAQKSNPNEALVLFRRMLGLGVKPDSVTVLSILSACGQLGALESGKWIHSYVENSKCKNLRVETAIVDMYCKCGSLKEARFIFNQIRNRDVVCWNSMIFGYATHGFYQDAIDLFNRMRKTGIHPTDVTFIGLLSACAHAGRVSEGRELWGLMKDKYSIKPKIEHLGCMVNLLVRAGYLEEVYDLVKVLGDRDPILWATLLWACSLHSNIVLGEIVSNEIVARKMGNSAIYTLLSNIYAAAGNWERVKEMRCLMKKNGDDKESGCSSIEVDNKVHEFLSGDLTHPKCREICLVLSAINGSLRDPY